MPLRLWPRLQSPLSLFVTTLAIQVAAAPVTASKVLTPDNFQETISQGVWFVEVLVILSPVALIEVQVHRVLFAILPSLSPFRANVE